MNILITGVAGLLGSNFARYVLENKGINIIGIDDLSGGYIDNVPDGVDFYNINLLKFSSVEEIFNKYKISYIYHFAAYAAEGLSPFIRTYNYNNNLLTTTNLINMSIKYKIKRFIFTSSMATYGRGNNDNRPFNEDTKQVPIDPYGISKLACEMDLKVANEQHGLEYCIIRPHNVYGINQNIWDKYRNVLGIWIRKLLNKEAITIYGDGNQTRAFTYIDDILEPLWNAGFLEKSKNEIINLGGTIEISLNEAADILIDVVGYGEKQYLEKRHEVKNAYCSYQKSIDILDFKMNTHLKEGLIKMWEWSKLQPNREIKKWDNYEIDDKMYEYWK